MYIIDFLENGRRKLSEIFRRPMVYLDHWALNELALCDAYRQRFTGILNNRGGMLRISAYSIRELANQRDKNQIDAILSFLDEVDTGFINIHPTQVIERENQILAGNHTVGNPSADLDIIDIYLTAMNNPPTWSISEIAKTCLDNTDESSFCSEDFLTKVTSTTGKARQDKITTDRMKKHFTKLRSVGQQYCAATRELLEMVIAFVINNQSMKMKDLSEWNDIFHLIVPVAYCDIVLLDKRWNAFVKQTGLTAPGIAYVYDKRAFEDFFTTLENGCFHNHT
jgi:hypothetical protein